MRRGSCSLIEASYVMPNETQHTPGAQAPSRSRRRMLLAATGALPSVLTLSSGAASAANYLACMLNQPNPMPQRFTPGEDNWVRAQVNVAATT